MSLPRLEIDLDKIHANARSLTSRLARRGISVTGVTKGVPDCPDIARCLLAAGVETLGDSRVENIDHIRNADLIASMVLIRAPMRSQIEQTVRLAAISYNSEMETIQWLSDASVRSGRVHGVMLTIELGDGRDGVLPADLVRFAREVHALPNIDLKGIGANFACLRGVQPTASDVAELSRLADLVEADLGMTLGIISGGNSANLDWAFNAQSVGRINNLRLGESILRGRDPLTNAPVPGLETEAITLVAEVIETKRKPATGTIGWRSILAIGRQDIDPDGLTPPPGMQMLGATSDHLVVGTGGERLGIGDQVRFGLSYSALMRAMTSPYVARMFKPLTVRTRPRLVA